MTFKPNPRMLITLGVICSWYAHSCQTNSSGAQQSFDVKGESALAGSGTSDEDFVTKKAVQNEQKLTLAHPKKPDAWNTRKLLMLYPQPAPARILECKETVESLTANTKNLRDLDEAALSIGTKVQQNKAQYHWCFYQLMTDLDLKLERDGPMMTEKSELFLGRMKTLWVIAKSLDAGNSSQSSVYNNYLRQRYMEISQHEFGRPTEVVDPDALMQTAGKSGKSASAYEDPE